RERLEAEGRPPSVLALELLPLEAFALGLALLEIQRNRLLLAQLPHGGDLAHQVLVVRVVGGLPRLILAQRLDRRFERLLREALQRSRRPVARRLDAIPRQRRIAAAFSDGLGIDARGQHDVRDDAAVLRAVARHPIVLADGQRELAVVRAADDAVEAEQVLHRALAEGLLADHDAA